MTVEAVSLFLALLAVVAQASTVAALVLAGGGRFSPALRRLRQRAVAAVGPSALTMAAVVAGVCTAGSLYFSEVAGFPPCPLCWYQRYCMYPLVLILGAAAWGRATRGSPPGWVRPLATALAGVGAVIATYHVLLERNPHWESVACDPENPCTLIWVERLGYLTIPTMALSGFLLIITLLLTSRAADRLDPSDPGRSELYGHQAQG